MIKESYEDKTSGGAKYEPAELEIIYTVTADVITLSDSGGDDEVTLPRVDF